MTVSTLFPSTQVVSSDGSVSSASEQSKVVGPYAVCGVSEVGTG